jgi:osmotically inducible protein OsmC
MFIWPDGTGKIYDPRTCSVGLGTMKTEPGTFFRLQGAGLRVLPATMKSLPPITETISLGGRDGSVETAGEGFKLQFAKPGPRNPQGLTPEHLFGAAWAACFCGAVKHVAKESGHAADGITVTARVQLQSDAPKPFAVELLVDIPDCDDEKADAILQKAHAMCAYSKATRGNVDVKLTLD